MITRIRQSAIPWAIQQASHRTLTKPRTGRMSIREAPQSVQAHIIRPPRLTLKSKRFLSKQKNINQLLGELPSLTSPKTRAKKLRFITKAAWIWLTSSRPPKWPRKGLLTPLTYKKGLLLQWPWREGHLTKKGRFQGRSLRDRPRELKVGQGHGLTTTRLLRSLRGRLREPVLAPRPLNLKVSKEELQRRPCCNRITEVNFRGRPLEPRLPYQRPRTS